jgi:Cu-Zn family superoxide dismutase
MFRNNFNIYKSNKLIKNEQAEAVAFINGDNNLRGTVVFSQRPTGVLVTSEMFNLPVNKSYDSAILGFHIHEGGKCAGTSDDRFAYVGSHYNPDNYPHPYHAGDLLPILSNDGYSWSSFLTNRFTIDEIIGRTVIVHSNPDDFTTQPSGNSGSKIACGEIIRI